MRQSATYPRCQNIYGRLRQAYQDLHQRCSASFRKRRAFGAQRRSSIVERLAVCTTQSRSATDASLDIAYYLENRHRIQTRELARNTSKGAAIVSAVRIALHSDGVFLLNLKTT